tara:strand:- start:246 stop:557 length:312 start_codon:yes stop_codon:yes gene_type:complete
MSYKTYEVRVYNSGTKKWFLNDVLHREDGPAIERANGDKVWHLNGKCHRIDGPAVERYYGTNHWFLNDSYYTEEEFNKEMAPAQEMTVLEVEEELGRKVKIIG